MYTISLNTIITIIRIIIIGNYFLLLNQKIGLRLSVNFL